MNANTLEQNDVAKRTNCKLLDRTQNMWLEIEMPCFFWTKAINIITFLVNHSPIRVNPQVSPFQRFKKINPMFNHVKVFGSRVLILIVENK
jgi:hypothetical protein